MNLKGTIKIERSYFTSDLCLATILKLHGCEMIQIDKPLVGNRFTFYFRDSEKIKKIVDDYFNTPIDSHPYKKFYNEMRDIKNMIYNYPR